MGADKPAGGLDKIEKEALIIEMAVKREPVGVISKHIGMSRQQVTSIIKKYRKDYRETLKKGYEVFLSEELERLEFLEHEYWSLYQRSKNDEVMRTEEETDSRNKTAVTTKSRSGDVAVLNGVLGIIKERSRLLNLYPSKKVDIDIRQLMAQPVDQLDTNDIEYLRSHLQSQADDAVMSEAMPEHEQA